jgi:hypothetical protein
MVQGIPIGQLCLPQSGELVGRRLQFQFGRDDLFAHGTSVQQPQEMSRGKCVNSSPALSTFKGFAIALHA